MAGIDEAQYSVDKETRKGSKYVEMVSATGKTYYLAHQTRRKPRKNSEGVYAMDPPRDFSKPDGNHYCTACRRIYEKLSEKQQETTKLPTYRLINGIIKTGQEKEHLCENAALEAQVLASKPNGKRKRKTGERSTQPKRKRSSVIAHSESDEENNMLSFWEVDTVGLGNNPNGQFDAQDKKKSRARGSRTRSQTQNRRKLLKGDRHQSSEVEPKRAQEGTCDGRRKPREPTQEGKNMSKSGGESKLVQKLQERVKQLLVDVAYYQKKSENAETELRKQQQQLSSLEELLTRQGHIIFKLVGLHKDELPSVSEAELLPRDTDATPESNNDSVVVIPSPTPDPFAPTPAKEDAIQDQVKDLLNDLLVRVEEWYPTQPAQLPATQDHSMASVSPKRKVERELDFDSSGSKDESSQLSERVDLLLNSVEVDTDGPQSPVADNNRVDYVLPGASKRKTANPRKHVRRS